MRSFLRFRMAIRRRINLPGLYCPSNNVQIGSALA